MPLVTASFVVIHLLLLVIVFLLAHFPSITAVVVVACCVVIAASAKQHCPHLWVMMNLNSFAILVFLLLWSNAVLEKCCVLLLSPAAAVINLPRIFLLHPSSTANWRRIEWYCWVRVAVYLLHELPCPLALYSNVFHLCKVLFSDRSQLYLNLSLEILYCTI